jgi:plastocyanin
MQRGRNYLIGVAVLGLAACGGSSGGGGGTCTPGQAAAFSIASSGISPKAVCVLPGGTVTFTNNDVASHDIEADSASCPALNLGVIAAAQSKTATFPAVQTCTFHDATAPTNAAFHGTVAVNTVVVSGGGY